MTRITDERIASLARQYLGTCKRVFYTKWKDGIDIEYPTLEVEQFARAIEAELSKQEPVACKGIPDPDCNYLMGCGQVCNKCGRVHRHHMVVAAASAHWKPAAPDTVQVPREPTREIREAICRAKNNTRQGTLSVLSDNELDSLYRAMIAAAPKDTTP